MVHMKYIFTETKNGCKLATVNRINSKIESVPLAIAVVHNAIIVVCQKVS